MRKQKGVNGLDLEVVLAALLGLVVLYFITRKSIIKDKKKQNEKKNTDRKS
jgi:hypothetical protein